jgi:phosphate/sulfate permease
VSSKRFYYGLAICFAIALLAAPFPHIAMWVGFIYAAYSVVANDSIQTLGTFLEANRERSAWMLWCFVAGLLLTTSFFSWSQYGGDVTFQRLSAKGFEQAPTEFTFLQVAAPLFLLVLTRKAIPVSTTFLILSAFAASLDSIGDVIGKSLSGYYLAFACSLMLWLVTADWTKTLLKGEPAKYWYPIQWITSGMLWSVWVMQDAANVAVYLPRKLNGLEFLAFGGILIGALFILIKNRGGEIQQVLTEKCQTGDIRQATFINVVYASILYYFKVVSPTPMSTTWVFIGLLAGREIAMRLRKNSKRSWKLVFRLVARDLLKVALGLGVSIVLALWINPTVRQEVAEMIYTVPVASQIVVQPPTR